MITARSQLLLSFVAGATLSAEGALAASAASQMINAAMAADGYVYVGSERRLVVVDALDPGSPIAMGETSELPDHIFAIDVAGAYAYVAAGEAGLQIVDVSNAALPTVVGAYDTLGSTTGIDVQGRYAYLADGQGGVKVIDVSNPLAPVLASRLEIGDAAYDIVADGPLLFVAGGESGLQIFDASDPARIGKLGQIKLPNGARGVAVAGGVAYVAANGAGVRIIDVTNPARPVEIGAADDVFARDVQAIAGLAYVASERGGVRVLDVTEPSAPVHTGSYSAVTSANSVHVAEDYLFIADGGGGLQVINVAGGNAVSFLSLQPSS